MFFLVSLGSGLLYIPPLHKIFLPTINFFTIYKYKTSEIQV